MAGKRVLVCGGRDFDDRRLLFSALDSLESEVRGIAAIIHGAARGADRLAGEWARARGVSEEPFPADWNSHGRAAGPIRNRRMLVEGRPDLVVAFPGGKGTVNMCEQAEKAGVPVRRVGTPTETEGA